MRNKPGGSDEDALSCAAAGTDNGQNCADDIYAVSLPAVLPANIITWFQAQEACANSAKRLPTNAEWQVGANGAPDADGTDNGTMDCNTSSTFSPVATGSRAACVSTRGAFDMVGNVGEWVADWVPAPTDRPGWGVFSDDAMCVGGASTTDKGPAALMRGGTYAHGASAGPLTVNAILPTLGGRVALENAVARLAAGVTAERR